MGTYMKPSEQIDTDLLVEFDGMIQYAAYLKLGAAAWRLAQRTSTIMRHYRHVHRDLQSRALFENRRRAVRLAIQEVEKCLNQF